MKKMMKQFVYVDEVLVNSILAQIEEGLTESQTLKAQQSDTMIDQSSKGSSVSAHAKAMPMGMGGALDYNVVNNKKQSNSLSELTEETQNIVMNDFAVERLIKLLNLTKRTDISSLKVDDGTIILHEFNEFVRIDFDSVTGAVDSTALATLREKSLNEQITELKKTSGSIGQKELTRLIKEVRATSQEEFSDTRNVFNLGKSAFSQSDIYIFSKQAASISNQTKNRSSNAQMQMMNGTSMPITILGIKKSEFSNKPIDFENSSSALLTSLDKFIQNTIFDSFDLLENGAPLIDPIAIYFDVPFVI